MRFLGDAAAMVARHEAHDVDLLRLEAPEIAVLDQIEGMPMVALVADVLADIVQQRGILEPFPLAIRQRCRCRV